MWRNSGDSLGCVCAGVSPWLAPGTCNGCAESELYSRPKRTNYIRKQGNREHAKQERTYFVPCAANAHPILEGGVCYSLQGLRFVLRKAEVVVGAHVDDIVQRPPSKPAGG